MKKCVGPQSEALWWYCVKAALVNKKDEERISKNVGQNHNYCSSSMHLKYDSSNSLQFSPLLRQVENRVISSWQGFSRTCLENERNRKDKLDEKTSVNLLSSLLDRCELLTFLVYSPVVFLDEFLPKHNRKPSK